MGDAAVYGDFEDEVGLNFPRKRISVAGVVVFDDDDDDADLLRKLKRKSECLKEGVVIRTKTTDKSVSVGSEEAVVPTKKKKENKKKKEAWMEGSASARGSALNSLWYDTVMKKVPPLCSREIGNHHISDDAYIVNVDVTDMDRSDYDELLYFRKLCLEKRHLVLFDHPGDPGIGGLASAQGEDIKNPDHRDVVMSAIKEYQKLNQNVDLKLLKLMKMNWALWGGEMRYFMTFSAVDVKTGKESIYQAAMAEQDELKILGLFRDTCEDKVLAIISLTGAPKRVAS